MEYDYDLGPFSRRITTDNDAAQRWFDRGLNWCYGFNHEEAIACFSKALDADPNCAMAQWGIAYAAGPNYNMPWTLFDDKSRAKALAQAYDAIQAAAALKEDASAIEAALIEAMQARYPQRDLIDDMHAWDQDFAKAMRAVSARYPDDAEVTTVFVDALLNLTPWKMWDIATNEVAPNAHTREAEAVLERQLAQPGGMDHPGLLHLYVHLMEMSPYPEKALKAGDRLRTLCPDAGHLIHMPTHIDVLCGHYENVVRWNEQAIVADMKYYNAEGAFNFYTGYRQHDYHFAIYGAMFLGQYEPAMRAVRGLEETTPEALMKVTSPPMADFMETKFSMKPHVLIRFGMWEEILKLPDYEDPDLYVYCTALLEYARGLALSALGRVEEAEAKLEVFQTARVRVPDSRMDHNVKGTALLEVAEAMLLGELTYRKGEYDTAFAHLRHAVALDDALPYDEPWGWMQPTRHALGALLFEQGHFEEAETVFRQDLGLAPGLPRACVHPDNVWALRGLYDSLQAQGKEEEAAGLKLRLDLAEARADRPVRAACGCAQVAMAAG